MRRRTWAVPPAVVAGDDALFDDGLFAAQAEERAAERLDVAAPLAVRQHPPDELAVPDWQHDCRPGRPAR
ncbi:MAG: hypothetical protein M3257_06315 [Actinomycetota bacterium]|nr:hypothetical protein [Actinomycetota bacterium]